MVTQTLLGLSLDPRGLLGASQDLVTLVSGSNLRLACEAVVSVSKREKLFFFFFLLVRMLRLIFNLRTNQMYSRPQSLSV